MWLINKHAAPIKYNATNMRTYKLAYYFTQMGYNAYIISSSFVHNRNIDLINSNKHIEEKEYDGVKFIHIKTCPYSSNKLKRVYSIYQFSKRLLQYKNALPKPDIIIHSCCIPFDYLIYKCAKNLKAKYVLEIVDLWPESFVAFGLMKKNNPLLKLMYQVEKYLYTKADNVVFSMEGGIDYLKEKKWDLENGGSIDLGKVYYLNNGVDIDDFDENLVNYKIEDRDLENDDVKKVIYLGSIRRANNLMQLIKAASYFKNDSSVKFLIYGDGEDREVLVKYCSDHGLTNICFKQKWIEPKYVPFVLSCSYINIVNYMPNAVVRYGGSQNKLFQALASGRPICSNVGMGYSIITKYNVGCDVNFKNSYSYYKAIKMLLDLPNEEYEAMCRRARVAAIDFDLKKLAEIYSQELLS